MVEWREGLGNRGAASVVIFEMFRSSHVHGNLVVGSYPLLNYTCLQWQTANAGTASKSPITISY
eukprot:3976685-Amphidinium_carterae.1